MKMRLVAISVVLLVLGGVMVWADLKAGTKAPDFTLQTLDCKTFKLSDNFAKPGKVVVLDLWATWCPPCQAVIPNLVKLNKKYEGKAVKFVGVALDDDKDIVQEYVTKNGVKYTTCLDPGGAELNKLYKLSEGIPALYVIDKTGVIKMMEVGFPRDKQMQAKKIKQLTDTVDRLLKK